MKQGVVGEVFVVIRPMYSSAIPYDNRDACGGKLRRYLLRSANVLKNTLWIHKIEKVF
jgi:predicted nucleic acid-binding Zn ribbon protein